MAEKTKKFLPPAWKRRPVEIYECAHEGCQVRYTYYPEDDRVGPDGAKMNWVDLLDDYAYHYKVRHL